MRHASRCMVLWFCGAHQLRLYDLRVYVCTCACTYAYASLCIRRRPASRLYPLLPRNANGRRPPSPLEVCLHSAFVYRTQSVQAERSRLPYEPGCCGCGWGVVSALQVLRAWSPSGETARSASVNPHRPQGVGRFSGPKNWSLGTSYHTWKEWIRRLNLAQLLKTDCKICHPGHGAMLISVWGAHPPD
jgi:hypothetical protein